MQRKTNENLYKPHDSPKFSTSKAGYTHSHFNNLISSKPATLLNIDLTHLGVIWSLLCANCMMKTQTELQPTTCMNLHQWNVVIISFGWLVDVDHSSSHAVRWSCQLCDTVNFIAVYLWSQDHDNCNPWTCLTVQDRTTVLEPRSKVSKFFSHIGCLLSGVTENYKWRENYSCQPKRDSQRSAPCYPPSPMRLFTGKQEGMDRGSNG